MNCCECIDYQKGTGSVWPKCKYSPQSAVEGRLYLISQQEADKLDEQLDSKQIVSAFNHFISSSKVADRLEKFIFKFKKLGQF